MLQSRKAIRLSRRTESMNKSMKICCALAAVISVLLSGALLIKYIRKTRDLSSLEEQLTVSRTHWETVAAEKESLQNMLVEVTSQLREANLTIEESETRTAELNTDITLLESEIQSLTSQLEQLEIPSDPS